MSVVAAGIIAGGTVVSGAMAADSAKSASKRAAAMSKAQLDFEKQKHQEWKDVYGDIETNLGEYYNSLTPDFYAAQGLEAFQKEQDTARMQIKTSLAQRGIEDSGLAIAMEQNADQEAAVNRASIRAQAPGMVAEEKRQFLQVGLGQNPGQGVSQALSTQASQAQRTADQANAVAGQAVSTAVRTAGTALSDYFAKPGQTAMAPTTPVTNPVFADVGTTSAASYNAYDTTA
tara:strand:+ start:10951 stop:11643 length:693 start_codon:yes stop_codon:yes gene_type:complete